MILAPTTGTAGTFLDIHRSNTEDNLRSKLFKVQMIDCSEKYRPPAWCDRVLWKGERIKQLEYTSVMELQLSDHKPVYAVFSTGVNIQISTYNELNRFLIEIEIMIPFLFLGENKRRTEIQTRPRRSAETGG